MNVVVNSLILSASMAIIIIDFNSHLLNSTWSKNAVQNKKMQYKRLGQC